MEAIEIAKSMGAVRQVESNDVLGLIRDFIIESERDNQFAAGLLREVKLRAEAVDVERRKISDPLRVATQAVNDLFRPARDGYAEAEKILKSKIVDYVVARDVANRAALETAAKSDTPEAAEQALATMAVAAPPAGVSIRQVWKFEVVDASLVPRAYCSPDPKKIGSADPEVGVPGVRFYQEAQAASRRA